MNINGEYVRQLKEFISVMHDDFFIRMDDFNGFHKKPFNTNNLTVLDMVSICESYTLSLKKTPPLEVANILAVILYRIQNVGGKDGKTSMECIEGLACFNDYKDIPTDITSRFVNQPNETRESNIHSIDIRGRFT